MKILLLCNNYGAKYDGIGAYSKEIYSRIQDKENEVDVFTSYCNPESRFLRILNLGMTWKCLQAAVAVFSKKYDLVIIEYPFVEWNPLFFVSLLLLKLSTNLNHVRLYSTLHEFTRTNPLRKLVIALLCKVSDVSFVTDFDNMKCLEKYSKNLIKIEIPSNISICYDENTVKTRDFVYFGIVNKAKAFEEMLQAWDVFNEKNDHVLYVITSSDVKGLENHKGVVYLRNANDEQINEIMTSVYFSILPIRPCVDGKNATFKTSCLAGCISIGKFCNEYKKENFVININDYNSSSLEYAFLKAINLPEDILCRYANCSIEFGKKYSLHNAVEILKNKILAAK